MEHKETLTFITDKFEYWVIAFTKMIPNILMALILVVVFWLVSKLVENMSLRALSRTHFNKSLCKLLASLSKLSVNALGLVLALGILKLDKTVFSILAGVGILGIALGFAFRDLAANFVSGLYLAITAPIKIGDVIKIGSVQGTVHDVHLRHTVIKNFTGQDILVPNKDFMNSQIENFSTNGKRKVSINVGIDYSDNLNEVKKIIIEEVAKVESVLLEDGVVVGFEEFADSSINLSVNFWIKYPGSSMLEIKNAAMVVIKDIADRNIMSIPYPVRVFEQAKPKGFVEAEQPNLF